MNNLIQKKEAFERLLLIMDELREKCPWDKKQTTQSLRKLTIEETYELADAILNEDTENLKEEVGDVMLHMVFYAKIAEEKKDWDIADALNALCEKLIRRHPHIYGDLKVEDEETVKRNWELIKQREKGDKPKGLLNGVPTALPALVKANRMQEKTKQVGFEWDTIDQVWEKVEEEVGELKEAVAKGDKEAIEAEFGDVLFSMVNYARFLNIDPELALERTNKKFKARFEYVEQQANYDLSNYTLNQMDALWNEAKEVLKNKKAT